MKLSFHSTYAVRSLQQGYLGFESLYLVPGGHYIQTLLQVLLLLLHLGKILLGHFGLLGKDLFILFASILKVRYNSQCLAQLLGHDQQNGSQALLKKEFSIREKNEPFQELIGNKSRVLGLKGQGGDAMRPIQRKFLLRLESSYVWSAQQLGKVLGLEEPLLKVEMPQDLYNEDRTLLAKARDWFRPIDGRVGAHVVEEP
ncbi:hypothetical protein Ancab_039134 [Ancistrocladus abbreviatus]